MLQVIKAIVNGQDGFIVTIAEKGKPVNYAFVEKEQVLSFLDKL